MPIIFYFLFLFLIFLGFLWWWINKYRRLNARKALEADGRSFEFKSFSQVKEMVVKSGVMGSASKKLEAAQVSSVYLVHGTFVGDDPFHIAAILERSFPGLGQKTIQSIRKKTKQAQNFLAKDVGNFVQEHVILLRGQLSSPVYNFSWSSANHHFARVEACISLIKDLGEKHSANERVLLIGHSHGGQIFAILSQLFLNDDFRREVQKLFPDFGLTKALIRIKNLKFDFVTLGTPARYPWYLTENMRLLHIINHRGGQVGGGGFTGASFTRRGDYIQQWGIAGSDAWTTDTALQKNNLQLEKFLGAGNDLKVLRSKINLRNRLHSAGHHVLVDYGDQSRLPNFFRSIFGHGVYTRIEYFPVLLNIIAKKFYTETLTSK